MSTLEGLIRKYADGESTANECAARLVIDVPIDEFRRLLDLVPERVIKEIEFLSSDIRRDRLISNYGDVPSSERLAVFRSAINEMRSIRSRDVQG